MARQRFIWPDFWTDPELGRLEPVIQLFFIGCFSNADDEGRLLGDVAYLRSTIFPYQDFDKAEVERIRAQAVANCANLVLYDVAGRQYLAFRKWRDYQKPKYPKASKLPAPPDEKPRKPRGKRSGKNGGTLPEASGNASEDLTEASPKASAIQVPGLGRVGKDLKAEGPSEAPPPAPDPYGMNGLPFSHEVKIETLMAWIGSHADEGTEPQLRKLATGVPEAALANVIESTADKRPGNRAGYVINALKSELEQEPT